RGLSREAIEEHKEEIFSAADIGAQERVRLGFLFHRIAENEKISVSEQDVLAQARILAATNQVPLDKLLKDMQKAGAIKDLYEQALHEKVLEFLENNAKIETVPAPAPVAAPAQ
ncbi:MAG: hypothetical protein ACRED1_03400, partial [Limisphaerales bacterium]